VKASRRRLIRLLFAGWIPHRPLVRLGLPMSSDGHRLSSATDYLLGLPTVGLHRRRCAHFDLIRRPSLVKAHLFEHQDTWHQWSVRRRSWFREGRILPFKAWQPSARPCEPSSPNARRVAAHLAARGLDGEGARRAIICIAMNGAFAKTSRARGMRRQLEFTAVGSTW
jgi:hypothetical protein